MRNDHKKHQMRKEQVRHAMPALMTQKQEQQTYSSRSTASRTMPAMHTEAPIKGKDMDLLNYTDL